MKLITRDTDYAVRSLCAMAASGKERVSVADIVDKTHIPKAFLRKIFQTLSKEGIILSYKGKGGGFAFARPANKIFLIDIINIFQGKIQLNDHVIKNKKCPCLKKCKLKKKLDAVERLVIKELKSITLASIV